MTEQAIFVCELIPESKSQQKEYSGDRFRVIRVFVDGEHDVLSEGCYHACRSSIDRYYRFLDKPDSMYLAYWRNESSFEVYEACLSDCA